MKLIKVKSNNIKISKFLFELRQKNYVKKNSLNKKKIYFSEHEEWLRNFFLKKNILFLIYSQKLKVGYVRLEKNRNIFNVSWAIIKKYQKKGLIKKGVKIATKNKNYKYKAIIRKNNIASKKIALNANFKLRYSKDEIDYYFK